MPNDTLIIKSDGLRNLARQISSLAAQSQSDHQTAWNRMQAHIDNFPGSLRDLVFTLTNEHQQRMSKTYSWQQAFADTLVSCADYADQVESEITQSFK